MKQFKLLFLSLFFIGFVSVKSQESDLPNLKLQNLQGEQIDLQSLANEDKPIVLAFWATWCMPCIKELNAISDVYDDWQEETGMKLYAVSTDDSKTVSRVNPMVNGKGWEYEVLLDTNNDLKRSFNIPTVPHTILLHKGKIVYRHAGYTPGAEIELYEKILELKK